MKKIILFFAILFAVFIVNGQQYDIPVEGVVYGQDTAAISGVLLEYQYLLNPPFYTYVITNDTGYYRDTLVCKGGTTPYEFELTVSKDGYYSIIDTLFLMPEDTLITTDYYLQELEPASIVGYVTLEPATGGNVTEAQINVVETGVTYHPDTNGYYEILNIPPLTYTLITSLSGYLTDTTLVNLTPGQIDSVNIILYEQIINTGEIHGTITAIEQLDLTTINVQINDTIIQPDASGAYSLTELLPGNYLITPTVDKFTADPVARTITLDEGQVYTDADFEMNYLYGLLTGTVSDVSDTPIEGAIVLIQGLGISDSTSSSGEYEFVNLLQEPYEVVFEHPFYFSVIEQIEINAGLNDLDVEMQGRPIIYNINPEYLGFYPTLIGEESEELIATFTFQNLLDTLFISSTNNFPISLDGIEYKNDWKVWDIDTVVSDTIYVKFTPSIEGEFSGNITFTTTEAVEKSINLFGKALLPLDVSIEDDIGVICPFDETTITATATGGIGTFNKYVWRWDGNVATTEVGLFTTNTFSATTTVDLEVFDTLGYTGTASIEVEVYLPASITGNPASQGGCEGDTLTFTVEVDDTTNVFYQWWQTDKNGNWAMLGDSPKIKGSKTGQLTLLSIDYDFNGNSVRCLVTRCQNSSESLPASIFLNPLPNDSIIIKGDPAVVLISPDSGSFYQWYKNGIPIAGEDKQFYYPGDPGFGENTYSLFITSINGCSCFSEEITTSMIKDYLAAINAEVFNVVVYPNPNNGMFTIRPPSRDFPGTAWISIIDQAGHLVFSEQVYMDADSEFDLNVSHLCKGMYFLKFQSEKGCFISKLILK